MSDVRAHVLGFRPWPRAAALLAFVLVGALAALLGTIGEDSRATAAAAACRPHVHQGVLPRWARAGFSAKKPRMPHLIGRSSSIAGILWGLPLTSPPSRDHSNKILWVSRRSVRAGSDLRIRAQRMRGRRALGRPVRRTVAGGPGPSIIDLPHAGCWRFTLRWSGRQDRLDVRYVRRR